MPTWSSSASARSPRPTWPPRPGSRSTTGSRWMPRCAPATSTSSPRGMLRTRGTRCSARTSATSTGRRRRPAARWRPRRCRRRGAARRDPHFYTDQFELGMEYSGYGPLTRGAKVVYRGDPASLEFIAFWVADGRVVAGMNVNVWDVNDQCRTDQVPPRRRSRTPRGPVGRALRGVIEPRTRADRPPGLRLRPAGRRDGGRQPHAGFVLRQGGDLRSRPRGAGVAASGGGWRGLGRHRRRPVRPGSGGDGR